MQIQFVYFPDCPNHEAARANLLRCIEKLNLDVDVEELDVTAPTTPEDYGKWGSPTILVNGIDAGGLGPWQAGSSCRLYGGEGVPTEAQITQLLIEQAKSDQ